MQKLKTKAQEIEYITGLMLNGPARKPTHMLRNYAVDTFANISFYLPVNMANEVFLAGMSPVQSLKVRIGGAVTSLFSGRVYGSFRDKVYKITNTTEDSSSLKKFTVDTLSSMAYGLPIYVGIMLANGIDGKHMAAGVAASACSSLFTARPYGAYLDLLRKVTSR